MIGHITEVCEERVSLMEGLAHEAAVGGLAGQHLEGVSVIFAGMKD